MMGFILASLIISISFTSAFSDECVLATFSYKPNLYLSSPIITASFTTSPADCAKLCASTLDCLSADYSVANQLCSLYQTYQDPDSDIANDEWGYDPTLIYIYDISCTKTKVALLNPYGQRQSEQESWAGCTLSPGLLKLNSRSTCPSDQLEIKEAVAKILNGINGTLNNFTSSSDPPSMPIRNCSGRFNFSCFPGQKILGNLIGTYRASSELICAQRCYQTPLCASANFISSRRCELMSDSLEDIVKQKPLRVTRTVYSVFISDLCCSEDPTDNQVRFTEQLQPLLQWLMSSYSPGISGLSGLSSLQSMLLPPSTVTAPKAPKVPKGPKTTVSPSVMATCGKPAIPPRIDGFTLKWSSASPSGPRIVGGTEATPHSWPWQISLRYNGAHICGGSLIHPNYIVTAAHCSGYSATGYTVVLGAHDKTKLTGNYLVAKVTRVVIHPQYNIGKENNNDIAVMKLDQSINITDEFSLACLATADSADGTSCVVTGWGDTQGTADGNKLQQVVVPLVNRAVCNDYKHYYNRIGTGMICAGYESGGKDSCQGDSGGPLVCYKNSRWELEGVVSWGEGCARAYRPGVYARVSVLKSWVDGEIAK